MKKNEIVLYAFLFGLVLYLLGLFMLFGSTLGSLRVLSLASNIRQLIKIMGILLFVVGFCIFMYCVVYLYKNDKIKENTRDLIIEGKADVITILVVTYLMVIMVVICLLFDQLLGAILFSITIFFQSILNSILIKYFSQKKKK